MSVLIRGLDMPKGCFSCKLNHHLNPDEDKCIITGNIFDSTIKTVTHRRTNCPLVELPPQGRLIDADALKTILENNPKALTVFDAIHEIDRMSTIIEAED